MEHKRYSLDQSSELSFCPFQNFSHTMDAVSIVGIVALWAEYKDFLPIKYVSVWQAWIKRIPLKYCRFKAAIGEWQTESVPHSYNCVFDIRGTFEIFLPLIFERHAVPLNSPKFLQLILFKLLLHLRGFTVVTLKYWK